MFKLSASFGQMRIWIPPLWADEDLEAALQRRFGADLKLREIKRKPGIMEKLQTLQEAGAAAHATAFTREASLELARLSSGAEAQGRITLVPTAGA